MKHSRGIDLTRGDRRSPIYVGEAMDVMADVTRMMQWECIGGRCAQCEREGWVDRWELQRGRSSIILSEIAKRLRCRGCGNRNGNKVILGRLPRD